MARPASGGSTRRCRRHAARSAAVRPCLAGPGRSGCSTTARCLRSAGQRGVVMSGGLQYERLQEQLLRLRLVQSVERLPSLLEAAAKRELSYSDFLDALLSAELAGKHDRNTALRIRMAHFPFEKTLESFDFKFQPSLDPKIVRELATSRYIANAENVLLLGPPGVGKTHLAVALGMA